MLNPNELLTYTKKLSMLFVEDHDDLRVNTSEILKTFFKDVACATDGEDALKQYKDFYAENNAYFDIVLSDIHMPKLNGVELVENIYKLNKNQKVIILSAYDDSKYLLSLINLGIEQFIQKPIDYQDLIKSLLNVSKVIKLSKSNPKAENDAFLINLNSSVVFNRENDMLLNENVMIALTKYEIIFLQLLSQNVGKIYSNETITAHYKSMHENLDVSNIRKIVSKLRKKLPENSIECIYGIGYRIVPYIDI